MLGKRFPLVFGGGPPDFHDLGALAKAFGPLQPPPRPFLAWGGGSRGHAHAASRTSSRTRSATFSPITIVAALVLPETSVGITEASATRNAAMPRPRSSGSAPA